MLIDAIRSGDAVLEEEKGSPFLNVEYAKVMELNENGSDGSNSDQGRGGGSTYQMLSNREVKDS
jgi:hypothetical protein